MSYNDKHNEANHEDNRDGADDNHSFNWGAEGESDDPGIAATRAKVARSMLMTLICAHGTPMLLSGDEFGRSQRGNNNGYCQDSDISWIAWAAAESDEGRALTKFTSRLIALRAEHSPLRADYFMKGDREHADGITDIAWFDEKGEQMTPEAWHYNEGRLLACRRACRADSGVIDATLLLVNGSSDRHTFTLPAPRLAWRQLLASADPEAAEVAVDGQSIEVESHSAMLLIARDQDV